MGFRDKVSKAKDNAKDTASEAKETVSDKTGKTKESVSAKTDKAKETVSGATDTATDAASEAKKTVSSKAGDAKEKVTDSLPEGNLTAPGLRCRIPDRLAAHSFSSMSFEQFSSTNTSFRYNARDYSQKVAGAAKEVDFKQTYSFGVTGLKYGKKYGDYVPIAGGFLPYVGFVAGIGVGVVDSADILSAEEITDVSTSLSEATDEVVRSENEAISSNIATGGVVFADSYFVEPNEEGLNDVLEMEYDDFVDSQS